MRSLKICTVTLCLAALTAVAVVPAALAQDLHPSRRPSPMGMARTTLDDGTYVRVVYSRPYQRGRDNIFGTEETGALVPFGKVWRTGANEATEITVTQDVKVAGQDLPAGTYSMFTKPGKDEWSFYFLEELGLSGTGRFVDGEFVPVDVEGSSFLTVTATPTSRAESDTVDQLTISFEPTDAGADMVLRWIRTEVRVPIAPAGDDMM